MHGLTRGAYPSSGHSRSRRLALLKARAARRDPARQSEPAVCAFRVAEEAKPPAGPEAVARSGVAVSAVVTLLRSLGVESPEAIFSQNTPMSLPRFKRLVAQMPKIAKVVNQFESADIQREVLQALIRAFEAEDADRDADFNDGGEGHLNGNGNGVHDAPAFLDDAAAALVNGDTLDAEGSSIHA